MSGATRYWTFEDAFPRSNDRDPDVTQAHPPRPKPTYALVLPWDPTGPGGVNQVVVNLYRQIAEAGEFEPLLIVNRWSARRPIETMVDGRRTIYIRSPWAEGARWGFVKWLVSAPRHLADMWRIARRNRVVAFNAHYPSLGAFGIALLRWAKLFRGSLILSFHGMDITEIRAGRGLEPRAWRFVFDRATAMVACSRAFGEEVKALTGTEAVVVHNGLDVDHFVQSVDRSPDPLAPVGDRRFVLGVATFERKKGLDVLVRAFADVRRSSPGVALVLVGRPAEATAELRSLTSTLGLDNDVFFFENVPHAQVSRFFERAAVFCLPSRAEPFGIVILEAGAFNVPVVATRVGGIPEILDDGETGILVPPDDPSALAAALARVLSDRELAGRAGRRLHERVRSDFSWRRAYEAYRSLAPHPPEGPALTSGATSSSTT
ncbi:MAG TPA: glycosyltransferase family 4 protein [Gemmatimonadaceae bacterium]|nr:glycosyltransferase family 4 protein [Gemmatimonadaceae bacterium]